jgi:hypothetical protein
VSKNEKPVPTGEVRIVSDRATGKVLRIETTLADGTLRVLYLRPLTAAEVEQFEHGLTATRH